MVDYDLAELVERVKKRDMLAMKILYKNSSNAMMTLSRRITQNQAESEDILQEAYMKSFERISSLADPKTYYAWLKRIVINDSLTAVKKKRHFKEIDFVEIEIEPVEESWFQKVPMKEIKKAIMSLPHGSREVFTLYLMEGYKHREIAEMLNISLSNSKSQYQYALKLLRKKLEKFKINR